MRSGGSAVIVVGLLLLAGCSVAPAEKFAGAPSIGVVALKNSVEVQNVALSLDDLVAVPAPLTIRVPDLSLDMPVEPHGIDNRGQMALPVSPFVAGWYRYGSAPGSEAGSTVIASHVDSVAEGKGPFAALRTVPVGTEVALVDSAGETHNYRITAVERINKDGVPWDQYFSTVGVPRLVLVTCGGEYDWQLGRYKDNYVVTAEKVT